MWAKAERNGGTSQKLTEERERERDHTDSKVTIEIRIEELALVVNE